MSDQTKLQNAETRIKEVAERIMRLREDLGITIEEMAQKAGLKKLAVFGELNREAPSDKDERIFFVFGK